MNRDEVKGRAQAVRGRVKQAVGNLTNDDRLRGEGAADELGGRARAGVGKARRKVGEAIQKAGRAVKR